MTYFVRGALVEYKSDFLGPVPNIVVFQFNPENLTRNIRIPTRPTGSQARETSQAGDEPYENISFTAHFSATDRLNFGDPLAFTYGIGPQLAALEKMVYPPETGRTAETETVDAVGEAAASTPAAPATQPIPRRNYPKILFIWGAYRALPVTIDSMNITEQQFDSFLNPIQAEVSIGLSVIGPDPCSDDFVARGAHQYSQLAKMSQAAVNLGVVTQQQILDLIPF
jgi:hypothetical protein